MLCALGRHLCTASPGRCVCHSWRTCTGTSQSPRSTVRIGVPSWCCTHLNNCIMARTHHYSIIEYFHSPKNPLFCLLIPSLPMHDPWQPIDLFPVSTILPFQKGHGSWSPQCVWPFPDWFPSLATGIWVSLMSVQDLTDPFLSALNTIPSYGCNTVHTSTHRRVSCCFRLWPWNTWLLHKGNQWACTLSAFIYSGRCVVIPYNGFNLHCPGD